MFLFFLQQQRGVVSMVCFPSAAGYTNNSVHVITTTTSTTAFRPSLPREFSDKFSFSNITMITPVSKTTTKDDDASSKSYILLLFATYPFSLSLGRF